MRAWAEWTDGRTVKAALTEHELRAWLHHQIKENHQEYWECLIDLPTMIVVQGREILDHGLVIYWKE